MLSLCGRQPKSAQHRNHGTPLVASTFLLSTVIGPTVRTSKLLYSYSTTVVLNNFGAPPNLDPFTGCRSTY